MADGELEHNPKIHRDDLAALHGAAAAWALVQCDFDRALAEDLMQDAYLLVLEGRARYDGRARLKTWLFGVIRGLARNRLRQGRNRLRLLTHHGGALGDGVVEDPGPRHAEESRRRGALERAMAGLPQRQREVLALVVHGELSLAETAEVLGLGLGSVRTHYHRAKTRLQAQLGDGRGESDD